MTRNFAAAERAKACQRPLPKGGTWTVPIPGTEQEGRSAIYRHWLFPDGLLHSLDPQVTTAHDFFDQSAGLNPRNKCLGHRPWNAETRTFGDYVWQDYQTIATRRGNVGAGFVHVLSEAGLPDKNVGIGLWCQNRPEWQLVDLGCMSQSLFTVSLYDTLGVSATEFIIRHAELTCVAVSLTHLPTLIERKASGALPGFKVVVCMDQMEFGDQPGTSKLDLLRTFADSAGLKLYTLDELEKMGQEKPLPFRPPKPDDIATINYTSGTTGNPKGVVLTHSAAVAGTSAALISVNQTSTDVLLSFLPLAHIFERICEHGALWAGAGIAYFHGNIAELVEDLKLVRPTIFVGVPRLYNRFGSAIKSATVEGPGIRGQLSRYVVNTKLAALNRPEDGSEGERTQKHAIWDVVWGRKVAAALGLDRCWMMITGSAPIDQDLHQFLRAVFGATLSQGYGLTEGYACTAVQMPDDLSAGTCGALAPTTEMMVVDVPDMGYSGRDKPNPRGELCIRGTSIMKGYYKNDEETKKAIDEEGWFHTGDIAEFDSRGRIRIIDRLKNFLKLSQGEYVSPEKIENVILAEMSAFMSMYVHGDSNESCLVAIAGVDPAPFAAWWASKSGEKVPNHEDRPAFEKLLNRPDVRERVVKEIQKISKKAKLNKFEFCHNVRLFLEPFTIENGLLTPTLKLKRPQTIQRFRQSLDEMYDEVAKRAPASKSSL